MRNILLSIIASVGKVLQSSSMAIMGVLCLAHAAFAEPVVQSYSLVSSVRSGRTTFDYTYRALVRSDQASYRNARFTLTSAAAATQVVDGSVALGDLDAGQVVLAADTFTIRQDRLVPFNPGALSFAFAGQTVSRGVGPSKLSVGSLLFLEPGGRSGHEGLFPIEASDPPAGGQIPMRLEIYGQVHSASYQLVDTSGQALAAGDLMRIPQEDADSPTYFTVASIPAQPFRVAISAAGTNADSLAWQSRLYSPTVTSLRLIPSKAILAKGETVPLTVSLGSTTTGGTYTVRLWLPPEWSGNSGPWSVSVPAGETRDISTAITAPASGRAFVRYTVIADVVPLDPGISTVASTLHFEVE